MNSIQKLHVYLSHINYIDVLLPCIDQLKDVLELLLHVLEANRRGLHDALVLDPDQVGVVAVEVSHNLLLNFG